QLKSIGVKLVKLVVDCKNDLGEGPVWDQLNGRLLWVDYNNGEVCQYDPISEDCSLTKIADRVMVVIPTDRNNWIVAIDKNVSIYDRNNKCIIKRVAIEENKPNHRLNDGKCDAYNRLWIGTMDKTANSAVGALYKVNSDLTYEKMDEPFNIPNGIAWNKKNTVMYVVDSVMKKIFRYDFNLENGTLGNRTVLIDTVDEEGLPDGLTIDDDD